MHALTELADDVTLIGVAARQQSRLRRSPYANVASIGRRLTHSLDFDVTLNHVARLPVPVLADWCLAYTPADGDVRLARIAVAHTGAAKEAQLRTMYQRQPVTVPHQHPLQVSLRSRKPLLQTTCSTAELEALCLSNGDPEVLRTVGVQSLMVVPMVAHGLMVGTLMLVAGKRQRREFDQDTLEAAAAVASCSAQAIYNAQLFWEAKLAARMRDEVLSVGSEDLQWLAGRIQRRVRHMRWQLSSAESGSPEAVSTGMAEIDELGSAITQRIGDLRALASGSRRS